MNYVWLVGSAIQHTSGFSCGLSLPTLALQPHTLVTLSPITAILFCVKISCLLTFASVGSMPRIMTDDFWIRDAFWCMLRFKPISSGLKSALLMGKALVDQINGFILNIHYLFLFFLLRFLYLTAVTWVNTFFSPSLKLDVKIIWHFCCVAKCDNSIWKQ